jgi:hypothetical protein
VSRPVLYSLWIIDLIRENILKLTVDDSNTSGIIAGSTPYVPAQTTMWYFDPENVAAMVNFSICIFIFFHIR